MDSLIAKADALRPLSKRGKSKGPPPHKKAKTTHDSSTSSSTPHTHVFNAINSQTSLPKSLRPSENEPAPSKTHSHIANKKLRSHLDRQSAHATRAKALVQDSVLLLPEDAGLMQVEGEMDRTWRISQDEIVKQVGAEAAKGRKEMALDGGPYRSRYSRNGRHMAIVGLKGHVATFDWQTGTMHSELQLQETCRDITFLQDHSLYAVAQKKYAFIYDRDGVEMHRLKSHIEPTRLEFLPYHWLLASVGNTGHLHYQDTSTGTLLQSHNTHLGPTLSLAQNPHTAVLYLGHTNGTVTLWTPNQSTPAVRLLAHMGGVVSLGVDPSGVGGGGGRYMATAGRDGVVKVWDCRNWKGAVRSWGVRGGGAGGVGEIEVGWSQKGALAVASGGTVNDILTIGHANGLSSILVPGSGEPNFDSSEADPFEGKKARREREVKGLLDKIQPDLITLDPSFVGSLAPPSKLTTSVDGNPTSDVPYARLPRIDRLRVSGKVDETEEHSDGEDEEVGDGGEGKKKDREEREKRRMRGKGKSLKRYLRKQRKNVIDPKAVAIRAKLEKEKTERKKVREAAKAAENGEVAQERKPSALDRFRRSG